MIGAPRHLTLLGLLAVLTVPSGQLGAAQGKPCEYTQVHMGLPVRIVVHADEQHARESARAAFERIAALDRMMSDYRPDSELRRIADAAGTWVPVSRELFDTIARGVEIARATDGAFDPSVGRLVALWRDARKMARRPDPEAIRAARSRTGWRKIQLNRARCAVRVPPGMQLDLGGIAKGYILQEGLRTLRARGAPQALLEAGGDIVVGDAPPDAGGWRIDAAGADAIFRSRARQLTNAAIATSGATAQFVEIDGIRYSHVIDPRTGLGVTMPFVARVIADDAATADALATALGVLGPTGISMIRSRFRSVIVSLAAEPPDVATQLQFPVTHADSRLCQSRLSPPIRLTPKGARIPAPSFVVNSGGR